MCYHRLVRVIALRTLREFWQRHPEAEGPLRAWYREANTALWRTPDEIRQRFRTADFVPGNRVVFNIGGNKYRLVVAVRYQAGLIYVRFVGTHAQYDRIRVEEV